MPLKDFSSKKKITSNLSKLKVNDKMKTNEHALNRSNIALKQIRTTLLNRIRLYRSTDNVENNIKHNEQQQSDEELERQEQNISQIKRRSIIKSNDLPRSLSKKTVVFASSLDQEDHENDEKDFNFNHENNTNDETSSETDIVTIIADKQVDDEIMFNANKNVEPYPFRSEIQLSAALKSHVDISQHRSQDKIFNRFIHHCHRKKTLRILPTINSADRLNRSNSTPNIMISSLSATSMGKTKTNDRRKPLRAFRGWFKSLSLPPFLRSNHKYAQEKKTSNIEKHSIPPESVGLRRLSELLF